MSELRLEIDKQRLDVEWREQPLAYWDWAKKVADAQLAYDDAKSQLSVEKAEIELDVRSHPDNHGLAGLKITEGVVSSAVETNPIVRRLEKNLRNAKYNLDIAKAAVEALEHRKRALTMLVELWIRDYYSDPKPPSVDADVEWNKRRARQSGRRRNEDDPVEV